MELSQLLLKHVPLQVYKRTHALSLSLSLPFSLSLSLSLKDTLKAILRGFNIGHETWEKDAMDRNAWRIKINQVEF